MEPFVTGGHRPPKSSFVSATVWCHIRLSSWHQAPPTDRPTCLVQVCLLRSHLGPPWRAMLPEEWRRLHHLVASVRAACVAPLYAGSRPPVPGPPGSTHRAGPDHHPAPLRLQTVHLLEVWGAGWRQPPSHPQLLRVEDQGGVPQPGQVLQRLQTRTNREHTGHQ